MSECYIGEIRLFAFTSKQIPSGWLPCDGRTLSITDSQYAALYALLGTTYGGDGKTTFNLPNLNGRLAIGAGQETGLPYYAQGGTGGSETVTLTAADIPPHTHALRATTGTATTATPGPTVVFAANAAATPLVHYAVPSSTPTWGALSAQTVSTEGGGQTHANVMPSFGLNYCIATIGDFPARQ